ncbi:MAG: cellulase family glycosylhydrolase [Acidobacteria bacterium]|nr:cellulase family glycosylhydrolase [Acidobacteriota bacterium]
MRSTLIALMFVSALDAGELTISGTRFLLDGKPFPLTGISFFNAIYNPAFNKNSTDRQTWMRKFQRYGVNTLRVWAQWDSKRGFADACDECSLYYPDGRLRANHLVRLRQIVSDADTLGMVIELTLFSHETVEAGRHLDKEAADKAVAAITAEMKPHRNLFFQVWNEHSDRVLDHVKTIKALDPKRLVTNSPGFSSDLGDQRQNMALDFLTPHTARQRVGRHWEVAPAEIAYLLKRYNKPVVDDEPARNGTPNFGGPKEQTYPWDQIVQIWQVWQLGGYIVYHHDMFQTGYGTPAVPPSGIPDPEFSPYHKAVLEFIAQRERYMPKH